jgi:hypothetical protein
MAGQFFGIVVFVLAIGGIAWGFPRWFAWRRSLLSSDVRDFGHV